MKAHVVCIRGYPGIRQNGAPPGCLRGGEEQGVFGEEDPSKAEFREMGRRRKRKAREERWAEQDLGRLQWQGEDGGAGVRGWGVEAGEGLWIWRRCGGRWIEEELGKEAADRDWRTWQLHLLEHPEKVGPGGAIYIYVCTLYMYINIYIYISTQFKFTIYFRIFKVGDMQRFEISIHLGRTFRWYGWQFLPRDQRRQWPLNRWL